MQGYQNSYYHQQQYPYFQQQQPSNPYAGQQPNPNQYGANPNAYTNQPPQQAYPWSAYTAAYGYQQHNAANSAPYGPPGNQNAQDHPNAYHPQSGQQPYATQPVTNPSDAAPLKSALKKASGPTDQKASTRKKKHKHSIVDQTASLNHQRTLSNPYEGQHNKFYHCFFSFVSSNEVRLEHFTKFALQEVTECIRKWWDDGIESEQLKGFTLYVRLRNSPWDMSGANSPKAMKLIIELFKLFAARGYGVQTSDNFRSLSTRLTLYTCPCEALDFFLLYTSQKGRRVTLVNPPHSIVAGISPRLEALIPGMITVVKSNTEETILETRYIPGADNNMSPHVYAGLGPDMNVAAPGTPAAAGAPAAHTTATNPIAAQSEPDPDASPSGFLLHILKVVNDMGFQLETTILMAPKITLGPLGLGSRREFYVFKQMGYVPH